MRPVLTICTGKHSQSGRNGGDDIWSFVESRPGVQKKAVAYWMFLLNMSGNKGSTLTETMVRLLPCDAICDGDDDNDIKKRKREQKDNGITADLLRELFAPQEDEKRQLRNSKLNMWLESLQKLTALKQVAEQDLDVDATEMYNGKIQRIQKYIDKQLDNLISEPPSQ